MDANSTSTILVAVAESLAALMGLSIAFVVFRMQMMQSGISSHFVPLNSLPITLEERYSWTNGLFEGTRSLKKFFGLINQLLSDKSVNTTLHAGCLQGAREIAGAGDTQRRLYWWFRWALSLSMVTIGGSFALLPFVDKFPYDFRELCICSAAAGIMCLALATKVILIGLSPKPSRAFRQSSAAALQSMIGPGT